MKKAWIYAGTRLQHLFDEIDLTTGHKIQTVAHDAQVVEATETAFSAVPKTQIEPVWAELKARHKQAKKGS